jgi:Carboxypeptidase regulatory-like domain
MRLSGMRLSGMRLSGMRLASMRLCLASLSLAFVVLLASSAAPGQSFTLSGRVVDARSGQAVPRSVVELNPTSQRSASLSITADEEGHFAFSHLAAGKYQLSASHRGYLTQSFEQHEEFSTAIAVGPGLQSEDLLFQLTPQSVLYGTITDETGEPVRRARVRAFTNEQGGARPTQTGQPGMTDDLGKYELAELGPGDYYLAVTAEPWYARGHFGVISDDPQEGSEESADSPLNVAYPTMYYLNATDAEEATPIPLRGGERLEINFTLNPQHAMRLRLPITQTPGAAYRATLSQSVFGVPEPVDAGTQRITQGEIIIDGVLPGHYDVNITQFGGVPNKSSHFTADVAAGSTTLNSAEMMSEVTVTGKVSGLEDNAENAGISLVSSNPQRGHYAPLDASGGFSLKVEPGTYEVVGNIAKMYLARVTSPNAAVHGRMLEVKSGASPQLEIVASKGFGEIDGFVTAGDQRPGGIMVLLAPENATDNRVLFRRDQSDSDGSFALGDIIPGRYRLYAIEHGFDLQWTDAEVLRAFAKKSVAVEVHAGDKLKQTVEVQTKQP